MAKVQKTVITALGEQMLFSSALTYTDATLCSQDVSNLTTDQLRALTDLTGKVLSSPISAHKRQGNTKADQVDVQVTFTNRDQKTDINYSSIGWFARDRQGHETLIAVTPFIGTDTIAAAPPDGTATSSKNITLSMAVGTATEINVLIDPAGSVTPSTFNAEIDKINKALALKADNAELADYAKKADVNSALDAKADKTDVASDVKSLNDAINTKASQADLDKTNAVVATKANATALADYARTVDVDADLDTKANKTDLESLAKTADVNSALDTKADKTTVDGDVKTLQASIDTKADKTALDDYAKSADVASDVKTLTDSIAAKADAKTVNDAISKIDFTPYAKSADVDSKLKGYTDTADLTKLLAGKADSDFSYSKAELDKKLLDLTTTTGGKVDASQVATMIENKADKSDVTKQIGTVTDLVNTKANSTDVDAALDKKDDITDVDAKIKTVTDAVNIKANSSDVNNQITSINKALSQLIPDETHAPELSAGFDLNSSFVGWRRSVNKKLKNAPFGWLNDMIIFQGTVAGGDGRFELAFYIGDNENANPKVAYRFYGWMKWRPWVLLADNGDISDVRNQISANVDKLNQAINTKANSSDVYVRKDVDSAFSEVRDRIGKLEGSQTVDSPDFNNLTDTGVYYVSDSKYKDMTNGPTNNWGVLVVSNGSNNRISQVYYPDSDVPPWMRVKSDTWHNWIQLGTNGDIQTAANLANAASNKVDTVLANSYFRKRGMDANGNCVEIRGNAVKQSNGGYAFDIWPNDWTASKLKDVLGQLPSKANTSDVNNALNGKANTGDMTALQNKVNVNTPLFREISADSTWEDIFGVTNPNNVLTSLRINPGGSGQLVNDFAAGIGFGGNDTKAVITVDYGSHVARFTAGNGISPGWSEDVAWKSDISSLTQALTKLQAAFDAQQTKIAALQATVNNQANQLTYFKQHYIEGKAFDADQIKQAMAWTGDDGQKLAIIRDKENEGGK